MTERVVYEWTRITGRDDREPPSAYSGLAYALNQAEVAGWEVMDVSAEKDAAIARRPARRCWRCKRYETYFAPPRLRKNGLCHECWE